VCCVSECEDDSKIVCYGDAETKRIVEALDVSGEKEGALRMGLAWIRGGWGVGGGVGCGLAGSIGDAEMKQIEVVERV